MTDAPGEWGKRGQGRGGGGLFVCRRGAGFTVVVDGGGVFAFVSDFLFFPVLIIISIIFIIIAITIIVIIAVIIIVITDIIIIIIDDVIIINISIIIIVILIYLPLSSIAIVSYCYFCSLFALLPFAL